MARAVPKGQDAGKPKAARAGSGLIWVQGILCGAAIAMVPGVGLLALGLLLPAGIALMMDTSPGRLGGRAVLLWTIAGALPGLTAGWHDDVAAALDRLTDPGVTGRAWAFAAAGWLLAEMAPVLVDVVLKSQALARTKALRSEREALEEEWGSAAAPGR